MSPDYYGLLGIPRRASLEQVKAAYRRRALKCHPDVNRGSPEAEETFKRCTEAYQVLSDPGQRVRYDGERLRAAPLGQLVGDFLDGLRGPSGVRRLDGADLHLTVEISVAEVVNGVRREVSFDTVRTCPQCQGAGAQPGGQVGCRECSGRGEIASGRWWSIPHVCPRCGGQGVTIQQACRRCNGVGTAEERCHCHIEIPPGVAHGKTLRLVGRGHPGEGGGRSGDLCATIALRPDPLLRVEGLDVWVDVPIDLAVAALGGQVEVPTARGMATLRIPPATQSGCIFRLAGRGIIKGRSCGDQLVRVLVEVPSNLGEEERSGLRAFAARCTPGMYPAQQKYREDLHTYRHGPAANI